MFLITTKEDISVDTEMYEDEWWESTMYPLEKVMKIQLDRKYGHGLFYPNLEHDGSIEISLNTRNVKLTKEAVKREDRVFDQSKYKLNETAIPFSTISDMIKSIGKETLLINKYGGVMEDRLKGLGKELEFLPMDNYRLKQWEQKEWDNTDPIAQMALLEHLEDAASKVGRTIEILVRAANKMEQSQEKLFDLAKQHSRWSRQHRSA